MKLKPVNLFHTPKSWKEIENWINAHNAEDKAHLFTAACMAWNLACVLSELEEEESES